MTTQNISGFYNISGGIVTPSTDRINWVYKVNNITIDSGQSLGWANSNSKNFSND